VHEEPKCGHLEKKSVVGFRGGARGEDFRDHGGVEIRIFEIVTPQEPNHVRAKKEGGKRESGPGKDKPGAKANPLDNRSSKIISRNAREKRRKIYGAKMEHFEYRTEIRGKRSKGKLLEGSLAGRRSQEIEGGVLGGRGLSRTGKRIVRKALHFKSASPLQNRKTFSRPENQPPRFEGLKRGVKTA